MKKILLAGLTIFGLAIMPSCSSDDDDNGNGGSSVHPIVGTWNLDVLDASGDGLLNLGFANVPYDISQKKIGGSGTLQFSSNPNEIVGNGIIEIETEFDIELPILGPINDSYTENEDLAESFANATYQILEGNKIRITVDGENQTLDYDISGNEVTLTGKTTIREENPAGGPDLEFEVDVLIKLSK